MSKRDVFKVLGCEGEPPLRKVTLEGWLQEEDACEYVPGSTVTLEFIGRQMPDPEVTPQAVPLVKTVVNTSDQFRKPTDVSTTQSDGSEEQPIEALASMDTDMDHNGN